jgi:hypothetical protein
MNSQSNRLPWHITTSCISKRNSSEGWLEGMKIYEFICYDIYIYIYIYIYTSENRFYDTLVVIFSSKHHHVQDGTKITFDGEGDDATGMYVFIFYFCVA